MKIHLVCLNDGILDGWFDKAIADNRVVQLRAAIPVSPEGVTADMHYYRVETIDVEDKERVEVTSEIQRVLLNMKIKNAKLTENHGMAPIADRLADIKDSIDNTTKGLIHNYRNELLELFTILLDEEDK